MKTQQWVRWLGASLIIVLSQISTSVHAAQTPWQDANDGWTMTNLNWPGYNAGYDFTPQADGHITKLGGLFNGAKVVRLYGPNGDILAQTYAQANNTWGYADIVPVAVNKGQRYTVAVATGWGGSSMSYGIGFPLLPTTTGDITIERAVFGFGSGKPSYDIYNQMWGQPDVVFEPNSSAPIGSAGVEITPVFPDSPITIDPIYNVGGHATTTAYLDITNNTTSMIQYDFSSSRLYQITLTDASGTVVSSSDRNKVYAQYLQSVMIMPGETVRFGGKIEVSYDDGLTLASGEYTLRIELTNGIGPIRPESPSAETVISIVQGSPINFMPY